MSDEKLNKKRRPKRSKKTQEASPKPIDAVEEIHKILTEDISNIVVEDIESKKSGDLEIAKKMIKIWQSAMDRKLEFNLSFETVKRLMSYKTCYYTGKPFEDDGPYARSFDRVDSSKGYIEGNLVACTVDINSKKSNLTVDEIKMLYDKLIKL
jgi:hypothetical protein